MRTIVLSALLTAIVTLGVSAFLRLYLDSELPKDNHRALHDAISSHPSSQRFQSPPPAPQQHAATQPDAEIPYCWLPRPRSSDRESNPYGDGYS